MSLCSQKKTGFCSCSHTPTFLCRSYFKKYMNLKASQTNVRLKGKYPFQKLFKTTINKNYTSDRLYFPMDCRKWLLPDTSPLRSSARSLQGGVGKISFEDLSNVFQTCPIFSIFTLALASERMAGSDWYCRASPHLLFFLPTVLAMKEEGHVDLSQAVQ